MTIRAADPLALLAIQAGQTPTPADQTGAQSSNPLDQQQRAHAIGDPVPIVFGRQRNGAGGVLISPGATECRFSNDASNAVTASYHLVLSEGRIGSLQIRDVLQRQCRVGSFRQTYDRRAGTWLPANVITAQAGYTKPEASYYCGSVGSYAGISTLSFQVTFADGLDFWNRQVHCFVRNGMEVKRWLDSQAAAPSDSFADLVYWLMDRSARIPAALIDTDSILEASRFLNANNITTNCWITKAINYAELVSSWGRYHLLRSSSRNGKAGLKPLLPVNSDGTIRTTALTIEYTFDDDLIVPGSVDVKYSDWSSRQPFVAQMIWRQQLDADVGIVRTAEVRYQDTAADGPYESHDLSAFCTREDHAVKVGAYILAKRVRSTHTIRFRVKPQSHDTLLQQGSVVRVRLARNAYGEAAVFHDYIYQVERITKSLNGEAGYECSHLPVDSQLRSLIALDVTGATGSGILLTSNLTGTGCDINSSSNTTIPADDQWIDVDPSDAGTAMSRLLGDAGSGAGAGELPEPEPNPGSNDYPSGLGVVGGGLAKPGEIIQYTKQCTGASTQNWCAYQPAVGGVVPVPRCEFKYGDYEIIAKAAAGSGVTIWGAGSELQVTETCADGGKVFTSNRIKIEEPDGNEEYLATFMLGWDRDVGPLITRPTYLTDDLWWSVLPWGSNGQSWGVVAYEEVGILPGPPVAPIGRVYIQNRDGALITLLDNVNYLQAVKIIKMQKIVNGVFTTISELERVDATVIPGEPIYHWEPKTLT